MSYKPDKYLFEELKEKDPAEVCRRALCRWDQSRRCFELDVWGNVYDTYPGRVEIVPRETEKPPVNTAIGLAVIFYLLKVSDLPLKGEWVSEKDLPGGSAFFRGPHEIPSRKVAEAYGDDLHGFRTCCEKLGGESKNMGDAAYTFRFLPRVPVTVVLWRGDNEFRAEARLLFDRTISEHLPLDVIFALSYEICDRISKKSLASVENKSKGG